VVLVLVVLVLVVLVLVVLLLVAGRTREEGVLVAGAGAGAGAGVGAGVFFFFFFNSEKVRMCGNAAARSVGEGWRRIRSSRSAGGAVVVVVVVEALVDWPADEGVLVEVNCDFVALRPVVFRGVGVDVREGVLGSL
jgi:hypothetical protein